ncbi:MAG: UDP-N-acetylmuramoyl-tripeptide--D-alanyl-D-alanine ligase, partial [Oscillospiraceae bacterium]
MILLEWRLTIKKVAEVTNGEIVGCDADEIVKDISKDSRNIIEGAIYIALKGDKYNGHTFVKTATESGAICSIVAEGEGDFSDCPIIRVKDTYKALRDIAEYYRTLFNIPIIGITGSVGKTSTKEMVASVLEKRYKTHKTAGNFNNEIGLPLTILGLSSDDEISVIEMGMSDFGEISRLTKIAKPDTAIITNIGV